MAARALIQPSHVSVHKGVMPAVPLLRPLGTPRRALHTLASAAESSQSLVGCRLDPNSPAFIRPDCPPEESDQPMAANASEAATKAQQKSCNQLGSSKPQFRSALEQVSFMTNSAIEQEERREGRFRLGLFGL